MAGEKQHEPRSNTMRRIEQEDSTGCGLACIAMLAGTTYKKVKRKAIDKSEIPKEGPFYTDTPNLYRLGQVFGLKIGQRCVCLNDKRIRVRKETKARRVPPDKAILAINRRQNDNTWHWVVYRRAQDGEYFLDPRQGIKSERREDFGRIKIHGYVKAG